MPLVYAMISQSETKEEEEEEEEEEENSSPLAPIESIGSFRHGIVGMHVFAKFSGAVSFLVIVTRLILFRELPILLFLWCIMIESAILSKPTTSIEEVVASFADMRTS